MLPQKLPIPSTRRPWQTRGSELAIASFGRRSSTRNYLGPEFDADFYSETIVIPSIAPGASAVVSFQVENNTVFEWMQSLCSLVLANGTVYNGAAYGLSVQIMDGGSGRNMFSKPVPLYLIAGTAAFPHVLSIPHRFAPKSTVNLLFQNFDSALTISGYLNLTGRKYYFDNDQSRQAFDQKPLGFQGDGPLYAEDHYGYVFNLPTIAAAATIDINVVIEEDSDFEIIMGSGVAWRNVTTGSYGAVMNLLNVQLTDQGAKRNLLNTSATPSFDIFGNGSLPGIFPQTHIIESGSIMRLTVNNVDAVSYNSVAYLLEGRKIFKVAG
jgi:hypothetical protein